MVVLVPVLMALVLAVEGCGGGGESAALSPAREFAPVDISRPLNGDRVQGRADDEQLVGSTVVEGRAEPGAALQVSASCDAAGCTKPVTAGRDGRFRVRVDLAAPADKAGASIVAEYATDAAFDSDRVTVLLLAPAEDAEPDAPVRKKAGRKRKRGATRAPSAPAQPQTIPDDDGGSSASATPAPAPSTGGRASGRLVMIGDSLAQGTEPYLGGLLGGWTVSTNAERGRPLAAGMKLVDAASLGSGDVLAVSLFTNDDPGNVAALRTAVRRSAGKAGCVIWATIVRPPVGGRSYAAVNQALAALDDELGDRMQLVPWAATIAAHPDYLAGDGVHATTAGYKARATLYANAARAC